MAIVPKKLVAAQQLTNAAADYYTVPSNVRTQIRKATFCNTSANYRTVTVYMIDSGGSAGDSETITKTKTLGPGETWSCPDVVGHYMEAGDKLNMLADAATSVTVRVSGIEIQV